MWFARWSSTKKQSKPSHVAAQASDAYIAPILALQIRLLRSHAKLLPSSKLCGQGVARLARAARLGSEGVLPSAHLLQASPMAMPHTRHMRRPTLHSPAASRATSLLHNILVRATRWTGRDQHQADVVTCFGNVCRSLVGLTHLHPQTKACSETHNHFSRVGRAFQTLSGCHLCDHSLGNDLESSF